jgi:type IV secretory pathway VirB3-like protein
MKTPLGWVVGILGIPVILLGFIYQLTMELFLAGRDIFRFVAKEYL